jgi:hypothetical protein
MQYGSQAMDISRVFAFANSNISHMSDVLP